MPRGIYSKMLCKSEKSGPFSPTLHQVATRDYFLKSPFKGLLLYHKLGSGKTCTSIMISDSMLKEKKVNHVYVLTPGSLREGWIEEYCSVCGENPDILKEKYTFLTYNYNIGDNLPNFDDSLVIVDEVHNLINGVKNMSKNPLSIYDALTKAKCRILALSGTPVYNYVFEFALLGNLLKPGGEFPEIRYKNEIDRLAFMKFFKVDEDGTLLPLNRTTMKRRLDGIISYYPGAGVEFVPEIVEQEPIKVQMTPEQEIHYWAEFAQEGRLSHPPDERLRFTDRPLYDRLQKLYIMAMKNILTRKASNFYYPNDNANEKLPDTLIKNGGWIDKQLFSDGQLLTLYSPKICALLVNITMHYNQKHVLFTALKEKSGVLLIKTLLGMCGVHTEIFSGDLDDKQRKSLLARFNSEKNRYGDIIKVLLVTEAGAEGISVREARHMHILESSPRMSKTIQAIGRVARYKSHILLPLDERKIKVWKYWSIASQNAVTITTKIMNPDGKEETTTRRITNKTAIDEILYDKGMKAIRQVESFYELMKEVSVTPWSN